MKFDPKLGISRILQNSLISYPIPTPIFEDTNEIWYAGPNVLARTMKKPDLIVINGCAIL